MVYYLKFVDFDFICQFSYLVKLTKSFSRISNGVIQTRVVAWNPLLLQYLTKPYEEIWLCSIGNSVSFQWITSYCLIPILSLLHTLDY